MGGSNEATKKTLVDRALGIVTEVHPREGGLALLLAVNVFLLLTAYYVVKPVREGLILATSGAEVKSYASVGQIILLLAIVPGYSALARRLRRRTLMRFISLFFTACLVLFYLLAELSVPQLGVIFFLWVGIFSLMVIAQFWSFATDIYSQEQGERLLPVAAFGASMGAVAGSQLTSTLVGALGVHPMLLVSALILFLALGVTELIENMWARRRPPEASQSGENAADSAARRQEPELGTSGAFRLVLQSPYLRLIALIMMLANLVNTTGEYILGSVVSDAARELASQGTGVSAKETIGKFYAQFYLWVNIIGVVLQLFFVSRILRYAGVAAAVLVLPTIALGSYLSLALVPLLGVVRWVKTAENATDYSLNNTVRNALFLPLTREEKYKAKQAIDTFFVRGGDVLSAALVYVGNHLLLMDEAGFAWVNAGLVSVWLVVALRVGTRYRTGATQPTPADRVDVPLAE